MRRYFPRVIVTILVHAHDTFVWWGQFVLFAYAVCSP